MGYYILSLPGEAVRAPLHPVEEKGLWEGASLQVLRQRSRFPFSPSCQPQVGRRGGARARSPHKAVGRIWTPTWVGPGRTDRDMGHLPSSSTFFPEGNLERDRVETSLRMQDLTGSKGTLRPGARSRSAGGMDPASARLGWDCRECSGLGRAPSSGGHGIPRRPQGQERQQEPREGWGRYQRFCPSSSSPAAMPPLPDVSSLVKGPPV